MNKKIESVFGEFNDEQLKTLKHGIVEMSNIMSVLDGQKEALKDVLDSVFDELKIPKKIIRKMAKVYHEHTFTDVVTENNEFQSLYEGVIE